LSHLDPALSLATLVQRLGDYTTDAIVITEAEPFSGTGPRIVYVNPAFTAMTGYRADEAIGQTPRMLQGPATPKAGKQRIAAALRAWKPVVAELLNYRKDGSTFWVELSIVPVADAAGWYRWWVAVQRDITARRAAEQERELHDRILASLGEGIIVSDALRPDQPIVYVNDTACQMTGYAREEFLGRNCRFLQGPGTDPEAVARMREAIAEARPITLEVLNYRRDGSTFTNLISITPMHDADGRPARFIGVQRDVTDLRARERQVAMAQRLTSAGELAGGIAHDFNNLLSSITGAAQLLEERLGAEGSPEAVELVRAISTSARRGAAQVRRLMALTRLPSLQRGPVDLGLIVRQLLQLTRRNLRENVQLTVDLAEDAHWIDAEPVQTESALLNLILNAQDAMPEGGIIRVWSRSVLDPDGAHVVVAVEDNGMGIDADTVERIFDPFFTTKAPGRGSGLGLSMTHSYMRQLGGKVLVSSRPGQGSRFELWFAAVMPPHAQPQGADTAAPRAEVTPLQVLYVEDDPVLRLTGAAMLEHLGHRVTACANGLEAADVLGSDEPIDLLCTDLLMPGGIDGWELANRCARLRPGLAVVVASGWADTDLTKPEGRARDAVFLQKPYSLDDLQRAIDSARAARR
jgi:PAS domain S-box-containing protein